MHDLYELAQRHNTLVYQFNLERFDSISLPYNGGAIGIDPRRIISERHEKLCLAHELGHCITGSFYNMHSCFDIKQKHENRADRWAAEYLMPKEDVEAAVKKGITARHELAEYFDVTEEFVQKAIELYYAA